MFVSRHSVQRYFIVLVILELRNLLDFDGVMCIALTPLFLWII